MKKIKYLLIFPLLFLVSCDISNYHIHTYEKSWSYDDIMHYHESTCEHELKSSKSEHTFDYTIIQNMSITSPAIIRYTCSVCQYYKNIEYAFSVKKPNGIGTITDPYQISHVGELIWFSNEVNNGNTTINAILTNDIVVNENNTTNDLYEWIPIGNLTNRYSGVFNGNHHTISGLYMNDGDEIYVGLFGKLYNGTIKNVTVDNSYIKGRQFVGGIVGDNTGMVENCHYNGQVIGTFEAVGGITGGNFGVISDSSNAGVISGINNIVTESYYKTVNGEKQLITIEKSIVCAGVAGIAGCNYGVIKDSFNEANISGGENLGGITGFNNGEISSTYNTGNIESTTNTSFAYLGGIVGYNAALGSINFSYNTGNLQTTRHYVGGITGFTEANGRTKIRNCYNTGNVFGNMYVGGINGYNQIIIENSYNIGNISGTRNVGGIVGFNRNSKAIIENCYNIGTIINTGTFNMDLGALVGANSLGVITNSYYLDTCGGIAYNNQIGISKTIEQFIGGEVGYLLSKKNIIWKQTINVDTYPNFIGQTIYYDEINDIYVNELK